MELLNQYLQNFYDTQGQFLDNLDAHDTWIVFNCWAIRERYVLINPNGKKNKSFLQSLDEVGIKYHHPLKNEKRKPLVLSDLMIDNIDNPNAVETIMIALKDSYAIIEKEAVEEYIDAIKLANELDGTYEDNFFRRIQYIDSSISFKPAIMSEILLPLVKKLDPNINNIWLSTLKPNFTSMLVHKRFDVLELITTKNANQFNVIIRNMKNKEKESIKKLYPPQKRSTNISFQRLSLSRRTISKLEESGSIVKNEHISLIQKGLAYKFHKKFNVTIASGLESCFMEYSIFYNFTDLYEFVIEKLKTT